MLTEHNVSDVSRRGYALLANTQGNNGRELRRFVASVAPYGTIVQEFVPAGSQLTDWQLTRYELYARQLLADICESLEPEVATTATTQVDHVTCQVRNSIRLWQDFEVTTASVKQLRLAVRQILAASDWMHAFTRNPDGEVQKVPPESVAQARRWNEDMRQVQQAFAAGALRVQRADSVG